MLISARICVLASWPLDDAMDVSTFYLCEYKRVYDKLIKKNIKK